MALPTCGAGAFGACLRLRLHLRLRLTERGRIWIVHYRQLAQVAIGIHLLLIWILLLVGIGGGMVFFFHRPGSYSAINCW